MRTLVEQADPAELVLLDGLKTIDAHGWTLVLPDPDAPATRILAEGRSKAEAEQRGEACSRRHRMDPQQRGRRALARLTRDHPAALAVPGAERRQPRGSDYDRRSVKYIAAS